MSAAPHPAAAPVTAAAAVAVAGAPVTAAGAAAPDAGVAATSYDVVVVGGGGAGAPLAARLSEDPGRRVLLLEAGPAPTSIGEFPAELLEGGTLRGADPAHPDDWAYPATLFAGHDHTLARGRILGGSTTVNGGYFVRARRADFDAWAEVAGPEWSWDACLPTLRALESDADLDGPLHGSHGPMPVSRPAQSHPVTRAFAAAAVAAGFAVEADKNGSQPSGWGPLPMNVRAGLRWNTALAYLLPVLHRPGLTVRGHARVTRVLFEEKRAIGVELAGGEVVRAREVVLAAGAIATPQLLLASGVGPREPLEALGIPVVLDSPGVGAGFSDHPQVAVGWRPSADLPPLTEGPAMAALLNAPSQAALAEGLPADLELLPLLKPLGFLLTGLAPATAAPLAVLVGLQAERSRGTITLASADPLVPPRIEFGYLDHPADSKRLREGVRLAVALLRSPAFGPLFAGLDPADGLSDSILDADTALDGWVREHLGTALHLCGSARMGSSDDPLAVADPHGRVHGVTGLRVADLSLLPAAPHRGPAATAVLIGERIAQFIAAGA